MIGQLPSGPANDVCGADTATVLTIGADPIEGTTIDAADDAYQNDYPDVYYQFTVADPGYYWVNINVTTAGYVAGYAVRKACNVFSSVQNLDPIPATVPEYIEEAGTYYLYVGSEEQNASGNFTVQVVSTCGNNTCEASYGEDETTCAADCSSNPPK